MNAIQNNLAFHASAMLFIKQFMQRSFVGFWNILASKKQLWRSFLHAWHVNVSPHSFSLIHSFMGKMKEYMNDVQESNAMLCITFPASCSFSVSLFLHSFWALFLSSDSFCSLPFAAVFCVLAAFALFAFLSCLIPNRFMLRNSCSMFISLSYFLCVSLWHVFHTGNDCLHPARPFPSPSMEEQGKFIHSFIPFIHLSISRLPFFCLLFVELLQKTLTVFAFYPSLLPLLDRCCWIAFRCSFVGCYSVGSIKALWMVLNMRLRGAASKFFLCIESDDGTSGNSLPVSHASIHPHQGVVTLFFYCSFQFQGLYGPLDPPIPSKSSSSWLCSA